MNTPQFDTRTSPVTVSQDPSRRTRMLATYRLMVDLRRGILSSMGTASPPSSRRSERRPVKMAVILVVEGQGVDESSLTVDLSPYGLRLQTAASLAPGQPVGVLLRGRSEGFIDARVVWVGKVETDQAGQAGLEFLRPLASKSLAA
jgi:hypothetical protein